MDDELEGIELRYLREKALKSMQVCSMFLTFSLDLECVSEPVCHICMSLDMGVAMSILVDWYCDSLKSRIALIPEVMMFCYCY